MDETGAKRGGGGAAKAETKAEGRSGRQSRRGVSLDELTSLCKRRGFVFPSSEIYGGLASAWDYGPMGCELKSRIQAFWWREMTQLHHNIVGIDAAIMMHPRTWEASGHVENFTDPLVEDTVTHERYRWDQLPEENRKSMKSPAGNPLTKPRQFNLMFKTRMGAVEGSGTEIYLRPETAQGIYVNFKNVMLTSRQKIPFGIAQVGKAFRNEITTKSFIYRTCEFEQMEMQFFVHPTEAKKWFDHWKETRMNFYDKLGIRRDKLRFHPHGPGELAHYAKDAVDIEYEFPFGWGEFEGIHNRGDYDLTRHSEYSGKDLSVLDEQTRERYVPYIIETSVGLTRTVLVVLADAWDQDEAAGEVRTVMRFHPRIAPTTVAVFPLVKRDGLAEIAREIEEELRDRYAVFYDQGGAIGRRYRRQDEAGTPYCVTVDYQTKEDGTVTVRHRDSMEQERVGRGELAAYVDQAIRDYRRVDS